MSKLGSKATQAAPKGKSLANGGIKMPAVGAAASKAAGADKLPPQSGAGNNAGTNQDKPPTGGRGFSTLITPTRPLPTMLRNNQTDNFSRFTNKQ